ncbi:MAG: polysaccharide biosynthesis/export family protein [Blastocatellia bacterium]|nr:polysaccharide biosynthesis/export family protein [Blastocatellia bacterium]
MRLFVVFSLTLFLSAGSLALAQQPRRGGGSSSSSERAPAAPAVPDLPSKDILGDPGKDYLIAPGDLIEVKVEDAPEISRNYQVSAAGSFEMQIIGRIAAKGRTTDDLARHIADKLRAEEYLKLPNVMVTVTQFNGRSFFIQGAVNKPGFYELISKPSLLTMISLAGGLNENHGSTAFIIRKTKAPAGETAAAPPAAEQNISKAADQQTQTPKSESESALESEYELIRINLAGLYRGRFDENFTLEPGDIVNIPRADVFFVSGEVQAPGSFVLKEGTTLRQAVSLAQGLTFKAKAGQSIIFREDTETGKRKEIRLDISAVMNGKAEDIPILANDVIIIPNSRTKSVGGALLMALGMNSARVPMLR